MPFPIELKYIEQTETELNVIFPEVFKSRMMQTNGGETPNEEFQLFPFWDKSEKKRMARTSNHIGLETNKARDWSGFPKYAIAIGSDGMGNVLILIHDGDGQLKEHIFFWDHETGEIELLTQNISGLDELY